MTDIVIYEAPGGGIEVRLDWETVWLNQAQFGDLFGRERSVITKHLRNVFEEGELEEKSNVQNLHFAIPAERHQPRFQAGNARRAIDGRASASQTADNGVPGELGESGNLEGGDLKRADLFRAGPNLILVQVPRAGVVGLQLPVGKAFSYLDANPRIETEGA